MDRTASLHARIENDFTHHPPTTAREIDSYTMIRQMARDMAHRLVDIVPEGRELSTALTRLEEVVFHANAGIARDQGPISAAVEVAQSVGTNSGNIG